MARALKLASGHEPAMVWHAETSLPKGTDLVVVPGGFSYGDYLRCGAIAAPVLQGPGVTVSFACEFLDAARERELVEGTGEIMRAAGSMIFLRGMLKSGERVLFTFSGTIKRVKQRLPPAASNDAG